MSDTKRVAEAVIRRGGATAEEIAPEFPELTITQVRRAMTNAAYRGLLAKLKDGGGSRRRVRSPGKSPNTYGAPPVAPMKPPADVFRVWG